MIYIYIYIYYNNARKTCKKSNQQSMFTYRCYLHRIQQRLPVYRALDVYATTLLVVGLYTYVSSYTRIGVNVTHLCVNEY